MLRNVTFCPTAGERLAKGNQEVPVVIGKRLALSFSIALLATATASAQNRGNADKNTAPEVVKQEAPKANLNSTDAVGNGLAVPNTYVIGPEDIIGISVYREQEISRQYGVRPDGKITVPLIKDIQAAGFTPEQLGQNIAKALMEFINKPDVVVSVLQVNSKKFFVTGEVNRPGQYALVTPITVFEALNGAGGFRDFANRKNIVLMRGSERIKFNYEDILKGKHLDTNIQVQNNDTIVVK
jgi:polysaccharide export outer membrane protein